KSPPSGKLEFGPGANRAQGAKVVGSALVAAALIRATAGTSPSPPVNVLPKAAGFNQIQLKWSAPTSALLAGGYTVERAASVGDTNFFQIANLPASGLSGPLNVSSANPRYFTNSQGWTLLLGGSHHWLNLVDSGTSFPPPAFDYESYLNFLST